MWMIFLMQLHILPLIRWGIQYLIFRAEIVAQDQVDTTQADWIEPVGFSVFQLLESEFLSFCLYYRPDKEEILKVDTWVGKNSSPMQGHNHFGF